MALSAGVIEFSSVGVDHCYRPCESPIEPPESICSCSPPAMEEEVWKQLPEELQLKLLDDHLPLQTQCRLRSVSKAWKAPRLRPETLHGLYIRRDGGVGLSLYNKKIGKSHTILPKDPARSLVCSVLYANCVNGLFGAVFTGAGMKNQVVYSVVNVFNPSWTQLPNPPPAPWRACLFAGLSKKLGEPPRIGLSELEDYIFMVVVKGNQVNAAAVPTTSLLLQVYHASEWNCSLVELPPGHCLMYIRCGVLRGSEFFFLTMHSNETEVSLCCVDVLADHKSCKILCGLSSEFVTDWNRHPKLAMCSGKVLLVHKQDLPGGEVTFGVEMLEEEELEWRLISSMPLDVKGVKAQSSLFYPDVMTCGGDELVIYDGLYNGYIYNLVTGAWSITRETLHPMSFEP